MPKGKKVVEQLLFWEYYWVYKLDALCIVQSVETAKSDFQAVFGISPFWFKGCARCDEEN